jgi:hypothetical protein
MQVRPPTTLSLSNQQRIRLIRVLPLSLRSYSLVRTRRGVLQARRVMSLTSYEVMAHGQPRLVRVISRPTAPWL